MDQQTDMAGQAADEDAAIATRLRRLFGEAVSDLPTFAGRPAMHSVGLLGYQVRVWLEGPPDERRAVVSCRLARDVKPGKVAQRLLRETRTVVLGGFMLEGGDVFFRYAIPMGHLSDAWLQTAVHAVASSAAAEGESFARLGGGAWARSHPLVDALEGSDTPRMAGGDVDGLPGSESGRFEGRGDSGSDGA